MEAALRADRYSETWIAALPHVSSSLETILRDYTESSLASNCLAV